LKTSASIVLLFLLLAPLKAFNVLAAGPDASLSEASELKLFVTADESSDVLATFTTAERYVPLAEILGADGNKWYLIKLESGVTGWMKEGDKAVAQKLDTYFKPVSIGNSFPQSFPQSKDVTHPTGTSGRNKVSVPIETNGALVIVPVTFNGSLVANLALDTGATTTMISRRIARSLRLAPEGSRMMMGIGGSVMTPVARLESVRVGDAEIPNLMVSIHDFSNTPKFEGLLGSDFLQHFEISLDARKRQLFLTPR
jgi:predicted aspartyl protease